MRARDAFGGSLLLIPFGGVFCALAFPFLLDDYNDDLIGVGLLLLGAAVLIVSFYLFVIGIVLALGARRTKAV